MPAISRLILAPLALGLALGGCGKKADDKVATAAGGEVLPGSISDDMIDLDTSTASPPLAAVHAEAKKKAAPEASDAAEEAPAEAAAPPADSADPQ
ncbi:hypothetical protein [Novosphingobium jiangmenense]|uniref:Lipoprotein n=1 Tax=Novosphingobium jiangmenense TaxID=2791981 RepID=A0ABS0HFE1_9SPHN|nr:hypothetical protein [Novosphingobium jiangmenense]MBF9150977.1 hypothetical protein [Novosphingobium jiangmenense]